MNYIQIMGGLGNQLFQYTFAKYLEKNTKYPVTLYTGFFDMDLEGTEISARDNSLAKYNISIPSVNEHICVESVSTDDIFMDSHTISDNIFFNGYWQDKKYFNAVRDEITYELTLKDEFIGDDINRLTQEMASCEAVSIHVRRKDYLNKFNKDIFYEISLSYYSMAVGLIREALDTSPVLYIFSDDYDYIEANMRDFCGCKTVLMKPRSAHEDLYLMAKCKHHIIANSTFGWWGTVLSDYKEGITIVPKHWFKDRRDHDLYFSEWKTIDNGIILPKISVIIPAYNVEKLVDRCLKSIEDQTYDINNLEVILINDASKDNTLLHLEYFEKKHPDNVILINLNENGGQGRARNIGLNYATGKYITFIDSDDMIDVSMIYKMYIKADEYNCDIVECGHLQFTETDKTQLVNDIKEPFFLDLNDHGTADLPVPKNDMSAQKSITISQARKQLILITSQKTAVWGKLYKKSFINDNSISFIEHLYFEDIMFSGVAMFTASSYYRINETLYYYFSNNEGTVFSSYDKERVHQEAIANELFLNELYERNMLEQILQRYENELSIYCTTKAFVDPLTLLINSRLGLNDVLSEINWFKERILSFFPNAAKIYNLADEYGICALAIHMLTTDICTTEQLFKNVTEKDIIQISLSETSKTESDMFSDLSSLFPALQNRNVINVSISHYNKEHLLIKHAVNKNNVLMIKTGKYLSQQNQYVTDKQLCSIINEYPENHIIMLLESLYYNESDECLNDLSKLIDLINGHKDITIVLRDEKTFSIARALLPETDLWICRGDNTG